MIRLIKSMCVATALVTSGAALAADSGWTISEADGQVSIKRADKFVYGAKGTQLKIGDVVRTGKGARAVLVRNDQYVVVTPKAQVRIAEAEEAGTVSQVFQSLGDMLMGIEQKATPQTKVSRPVVAAVIKGYGKSNLNGAVSSFDNSESESSDE